MKSFKQFLVEQLPTTIETDPANSGRGLAALTPPDGKKSKKKVIKKETSDQPPQKIDSLA